MLRHNNHTIMDKLTPAERSENMRRIRNKDTKPELSVRRLVHGLGFRYRLHGKLPGRPDMVFPGRNKVIFVHGCFWHQHSGTCKISRVPKSRLDYWIPKLERTKQRDIENEAKLRESGWQVLAVWECQIKDSGQLAKCIQDFLRG